MNTILIQSRQGVLGSPNSDSQENVTILPESRNRYGAGGGTVNVPIISFTDVFGLLPAAAVAAGTDTYTKLIGSNTPLAAQATKGGLTLTTGGTNTNQAGAAGVATTVFQLPITANGMMVFRARVNVPSLTAVAYYSCGLNQNPTDVDPTATAGEGVTLIADPTNALTGTTGATAAQALNWIMASKVAGADTFIFTGIPILAGIETGIKIQLNADLTATVTVEGITAGTSPALATASATLSALVGVRTLATATATMDVRYVEMGRLIG